MQICRVGKVFWIEWVGGKFWERDYLPNYILNLNKNKTTGFLPVWSILTVQLFESSTKIKNFEI